MELFQTGRKGYDLIMKVLVVCSFNKQRISPYVSAQIDSIIHHGIEAEYFLIIGKGITGYASNYFLLLKTIRQSKPDLIHAHYGLSGLLAVLQRKIPVITTFHGSDINYPGIRFLSKFAMQKSTWSIFVSEKLAKLAVAKERYSIIPCGVDFKTFYPIEKKKARKEMGLSQNDVLFLFSGSFDNKVKNYPLAQKAVDTYNKIYHRSPAARLLELHDYSREEVNLLLNACDVVLMTSLSEGSPNFIKEALACNRPVVSTEVGDVKELIENIEGCYIANSCSDDIALKLEMALQYDRIKMGLQRIVDLELEIQDTAERIIEIYKQVIGKYQ